MADIESLCANKSKQTMKAQTVAVRNSIQVCEPYHCVMTIASKDLVSLRGYNWIGVASLVQANKARQTSVVGTDL